ncbi:CARDB domain-containing protein [Tuwongella immobilis]|uniref:DUF11 domain-containing protein n=1 Tax=Tuwongella immobilis TaxID=692036 RepID=A0A6C2YLS0_9BACT|nr:CARDB domain-containing protein [Tuwongella immobilis]VIP02073.1 repeat domain protein : 60 kDa outer membrane protein OS=Blastopirellula marina DSM 3645 GN=DSM3645_12081 PE=4 SV=1: CARDB [Tuwongella immobilis]VTS00306.1 repeat domain protein : 60 kDa outer membrane protein OS=Blastopirellula marina DSM 3645 GN=DSM3645_12081 PE=4 SV=1: CARDB [Tuwongella immobilis]
MLGNRGNWRALKWGLAVLAGLLVRTGQLSAQQMMPLAQPAPSGGPYLPPTGMPVESVPIPTRFQAVPPTASNAPRPLRPTDLNTPIAVSNPGTSQPGSAPRPGTLPNGMLGNSPHSNLGSTPGSNPRPTTASGMPNSANPNLVIPKTPAPGNPIRQASGVSPLPQFPTAVPETPRGSNLGISPGLSIETVAPESIGVGQSLKYEIVVRNSSNVSVDAIRVEEQLPTGSKYLGGEPLAEINGDKLQWQLASLEPGAQRRIQVEVQANVEGDFKTRTTITSSAQTGMRTKVTRPKLDVVLTAAKNATVGDTVPFQLTLTNSGSGAATQIHLRAKLSDGLMHPQGQLIEADMAQLAVGETKTVSLKTQAMKAGTQVCELTVSADGAGEVSQRAEVMIVEPLLQVRQTLAPKALVGQDLRSMLEVSNPGTAATDTVKVAVILPEGIAFAAASDNGRFDESTRQIVWELESLAAGASRSLNYQTRASMAGKWTVTAVAQSGSKLENRQDNSIQIEGIPALSFEVVDLEGVVSVNKEAVYEVRVLNQGTCACTGIRLEAQLSDGMTVSQVNGPVAYKIVGNKVVFEPFAKLGTKADTVYRIRVRSSKPGEGRLRATLSCQEIKEPLVKDESTQFYQE